MELQCKMLLFLDKSQILRDMKIKCQEYLDTINEKTERKFPPLRYYLEVDIIELIDSFLEVSQFLIKEPLKWQRVCCDILFACLQALNGADKKIQASQINVIIRTKGVPRTIQVNKRTYVGLTAFEGIAIGVTKPVSYIYHTVWSCPEECEDSEVITPYIPKVPPKCYICRSTLIEVSGLRSCGEQITVAFKLQNNPMAKSFIICDDLIENITLGCKYIITALTVKKLTAVWSAEEVKCLPAPITTPIANDIKDLFQICKGIPWKFIYCLSSSIGVNVCPLNCFMHLKMCLLLSLVSVKGNILTGSNIIHVLAAGFDTSYVGKLMQEAAKLAEQFTFLGTRNTRSSTALLSSSGGVCALLLPLHAYNQKQLSSILLAIETQEIQTDTKKAKLQTAVWAQGMDFKKIVLYNVANVFGTVCRGDYGEYNDEISEFLLQNSIEPARATKEEKQAIKDIENYIDIVAGIEVSLNIDAENLLRNYFLAARREKQRGVCVGSMKSLVAMCLNSARLCRRNVANFDDAVMAIWLHVSGGPEPRIAPEEYLQTPGDVKRLQNIMTDFKDWLEKFTCEVNVNF